MDAKTETPLSAAESGHDAEAAALRHLFRNQIQTMTSLVGLFGRKAPPGEGRDAFGDLRARFDAVTFGPPDHAVADAEGRFEVDLGELGRRVARHLDPNFRHRVRVEGGQVRATPRHAAALAQILAELVIDVVRHGFDHEGGAAEIVIEAQGDGGVAMRMRQTGPDGATPRRPADDLGAAIADSLVRSLDGRIERRSSGLLGADVAIPPERRRR